MSRSQALAVNPKLCPEFSPKGSGKRINKSQVLGVETEYQKVDLTKIK